MTRKIILWIVFGGMAILLFFAHMYRDTLSDFISDNMKDLTESEVISVAELIDSKYNYAKSGLDYEFTLLEFGSTGCTVCKKMVTELGKVRKSRSSKINVVFFDINHPENQNFIKYFGISAVPMQIILDKNGVEFFKNYGFISAEDMIGKTTEYKSN